MNILIAGIPENTKNYERALSRCQVSYCTSLCPDSLSSYDKLLLPGGGDMDPFWFGQEDQGSNPADRELDNAQFALLHAFFLTGRPILGICRGMQLLNVYFGGDLIQHLSTAGVHEYVGRDQLHETTACKDSFLGKLYGERFVVNSAHHQGVGAPGRGILPQQYARDGVTEGLSHRSLPIYGVQWHPERLCPERAGAGAVDGAALLGFFADSL